MALAHPNRRGVALALDGDPAAVGVLRHQIDTDVLSAEPGYCHSLRPVRPAVHFRDLVLRVLQNHPPDQVLEPPALFRFVTAVPADALQDLADGRLAFAEPEGELPATWPAYRHCELSADKGRALTRARARIMFARFIRSGGSSCGHRSGGLMGHPR